MAPRIVYRHQWGATSGIPGGRHVPLSQRHWVVVHWPGGPAGADAAAMVRGIERAHRNLGWAVAPGYHWLVARDGTIFESMSRDVRGIHSPPRNQDGWGVCGLVSIGENPPAPMLNSIRWIYDELSRQAGRRLGMASHSTHHPTQCAGPALNDWVRRGMPVAGGGAAPPPPAPQPPPPQEAPVAIANFQCFNALFRTNGQQISWVPNPQAAAELSFMGARFHPLSPESVRAGTWGTQLIGACPPPLAEQLGPNVFRG